MPWALYLVYCVVLAPCVLCNKEEIGSTTETLIQRQIKDAEVDTSLGTKFVNWHRSIDVGGPYKVLFQPSNNVELDKDENTQDQEFLVGLSQLQDIVAKAVAKKVRVRAYGSRWSLNDAAYTQDYLVETWGLTYLKVGIDDDAFVQVPYQPIKNRLTFVQTGVFVQDVNTALFEKGLALQTSGAGTTE